jgi:hypothetical protein
LIDRYLIVIDDVQMDEWRIVKSAFEHSSTSSRIILTTTIQPMANMCSSHGLMAMVMSTKWTPLVKKTPRK